MPPNSQRQLPRSHHDRSVGQIRSMHDIFADPYRRAILYHLDRAEAPVAVDDLLEEIMAWHADRSLPDPDSYFASPSRTWLVSEHVVAMAEFGIVTYDPEREVVSLAEDVAITVSPPRTN